MARPAVDFNVELEVEFVAISEDEVPALRAGYSLLLQWLREAKNFSEADDGSVDIDFVGSDNGISVALLPLEDVVER
jgi:hypothetical protein